MKRILFQTILGVFFAALGIYTTYMYLQGLNHGNSLLFLCIAVLAIGGSVYFFYRAGKADDTVIKKANLTAIAEHTSTLENVLERNNELSTEWKETNEHRDRLRMLEITGSSGKS